MLRGFGGRPAGAGVFAQARAHGRPRCSHARRRTGGYAPRAGRCVPAGGRGAVRILHSRYCDSRVRVAAAQSHAGSRGSSASRWMGISAAALATRESSMRFRPPAKPGITDKQAAGDEPRRHHYFGEEYGLSRNSALRMGSARNGIGQFAVALSRHRAGAGREAVRGRHACARNAARRAGVEPASARQGSGDRYFGGASDAGRGTDLHRVRCSGPARHRPCDSRFADLCSGRRDHVLRRRYVWRWSWRTRRFTRARRRKRSKSITKCTNR